MAAKFLPYLLAGISVGGQYALIAIGYTMVYGILRLINFAHGDIFTVAGFLMVYATASLPLTISMVGYGGREYYGGVDFYPEHLEGGKKTFDNGDITYCEAHHNMAIFYAQTDNPNLSVDVIPIGKVTSDLAVFDTLDSREDITFSLAE